MWTFPSHGFGSKTRNSSSLHKFWDVEATEEARDMTAFRAALSSGDSQNLPGATGLRMDQGPIQSHATGAEHIESMNGEIEQANWSSESQVSLSWIITDCVASREVSSWRFNSSGGPDIAEASEWSVHEFQPHSTSTPSRRPASILRSFRHT
ncbi:hypothetical protein B0H14DRAFT_2572110 [Mycena olivaceomarginata]|nr:hypothetical protein B0H14DRAFT_2572110 [Mycena olivaceomarginata]